MDKRIAEDYLVFANTSTSTGILAVDHDVLVVFYSSGRFESDAKLFQCWFNTRMLDMNEEGTTATLMLGKEQLDKGESGGR